MSSGVFCFLHLIIIFLVLLFHICCRFSIPTNHPGTRYRTRSLPQYVSKMPSTLMLSPSSFVKVKSSLPEMLQKVLNVYVPHVCPLCYLLIHYPRRGNTLGVKNMHKALYLSQK